MIETTKMIVIMIENNEYMMEYDKNSLKAHTNSSKTEAERG
jgi:hypothetical protein